ncbi:MAG: tetratricopeptide repeat protein [Nannocystaceae bacterium]
MSARSGVIGRISGVLVAWTLVPGAALAPAPVLAAPAPAPAPAADPKIERAKELLENGARLYNEGSYEAAILAFKEGFDLSKEPAFLYNIGNCYERLGNFGEARSYLDQYRAFAPEGEREVLSRRISALDERLRKQREEDAQRPPDGDPPPVKPIEENPPPDPNPPDDEPKKDRVFGPGAWALTGVAVIGLGLGVGLGVKASNDRKDALDGCVDAGSGRYLCSDTSSDALAARKTSALVADIGFVVAGVAAVGVATLVGIKASKKKKSDASAARVSPYAGRGGAGLVFTGRF